MEQEKIEELLKEYGIDVPNYTIITSIHDIESLDLTYPVVIKIISSSISHKSDVGGVITNIYDKTSLIHAFDHLMKKFHSKHVQAVIEGFRVEEQITDGLEFLLGSSYDPSFGIVGAFGFGGIAVELYKDVVFFIPQDINSEKDARNILARTKIGRLLLKKNEFRGKVINLDSLLQNLTNFAKLLKDKGLSGLEINPLICNEKGCWACDIRYKK